jgi:hypothetical protein
VSQSLDQVNLAAMKQPPNNRIADAKSDFKSGGGGGGGMDSKQLHSDSKESKSQPIQSGVLSKSSEQTRSQSVLNKPFDEALEFSHSGSDESVDTAREKLQNKPNIMPSMTSIQQQQQQQQRQSMDSAQSSVRSSNVSVNQKPSIQQPIHQQKPMIEVCDVVMFLFLFVNFFLFL